MYLKRNSRRGTDAGIVALEDEGDDVRAQDVWRDIAIFPFCNTCARRMVWRDIMGADASAADPIKAAHEHFLGQITEN